MLGAWVGVLARKLTWPGKDCYYHGEAGDDLDDDDETDDDTVRGAVQKNFLQNLGFCPNEGGGGLAQSQVF